MSMLTLSDKQNSMRNFLKALIFPICMALPALGFSQQMRFDHLSVKQGLSQGNVTDLLQDKFGFIWIATEDGLNFYDGYKVTVFRTNPDDSTSISNNSIQCLQQDDVGNIWIGTQGGLNLYNRVLNRFEHFTNDPADNLSLAGNSVTAVYIDPDKKLWVGASGTLHLYDVDKKNFKRFAYDANNPKTLRYGAIESIIKDTRNRLLIGINNGGLSVMNDDGETFTNYYHDPANPSSINDSAVKCIFEDSEKKIWIATSFGGLNLFNENGTFTHFQHNPDDPTSIASSLVRGIGEDKSGQLWVSTDASLNLMNKKDGTFTHIYNDPSDEKSINSNIAVKVIFDVNDRMWVGTRFGGVNIYDKDRYLFELYKHNPLDKNSLDNNNVSSFSEDVKGNIWVGTDGGGLNYLDRKTRLITSIVHDPNNINTPTNNKILAVQASKDGGVWMGMWDGGVNYYNPTTRKFRHYINETKNPHSLSDTRVFKIFEDSKGRIWIGAFEKGLNKYNPGTDDFTTYLPDDESNGNQSSINDIVEDHSGNIWLATQRGLYMFDPVKEVFTHYANEPKDGSLSSNSILSVLFDSKNRLWVGTDGGGLNLLDSETGTFKVFRKRDGLPNDAIIGILEDDDHNLWISTNQGLCKFNPDKLTFKNYDESYALQDNQFNRWSYARLSTGELLFGGANGFNLFDPKKIRDNPFIPAVYITDFKLFNKVVPIGKDEILKKNIILTNEISLPYSQNFFTFEFTALNYRQTEKNQYKYIMEGFQDDWIDAGTERKVSYTNLSPGEYVFRVIASNNDGVWNKEGTSLKIIIVPPFWRTAWFIGLLLLVTSLSIFSFVLYQRIKTKKQKEELNAIIEERTDKVLKQNEEILKKNEVEKIQNWIVQGLAFFGEIMSQHKGNLEELSNEILVNLAKYVNAKQGSMAIVVTDDETNHQYLQIMSTYAVNSARLKSKRLEVDEGLIGATFGDRQKKYITNLSENYIQIESGLGQATPTKLILLPLQTDGDIYGVIELAFLEEVTDVVHEFLDKVAKVIAMNINSATLNHKTQMLLQQSKEQTEELRAQEEEMRQNMEEMEATQEELRRREESMQEKMTESEALQTEFKRKEQEYLRKIDELKKGNV